MTDNYSIGFNYFLTYSALYSRFSSPKASKLKAPGKRGPPIPVDRTLVTHYP